MQINIAEIKSISTVVDDTLKYIERRKKGKERSLRVASAKVNSTFMDGFDWGRIVTVAGQSGSGKSTLVRQWIREIIDLNPEQKVEVLSFQFEMLGIDEVGRDLSAKLSAPLKDIYSAPTTLSEESFERAKIEAETLKTYPIHIVDTPSTVETIKDTILYFALNNLDIQKRKRGLIVTLDNTLLVKEGEKDRGEKGTIDNLMYTLVELKKQLSSMGIKVLFFIISQLNRNIESSERIVNPKLHYPIKSDIFGASSVYNSSDYVIIIVRPTLMEGIGNWYGPPKQHFPQGLPVYNPYNSQQPMIYLHVIKERFGTPRILAMCDDLAIGKISEYLSPT